MVYLPHFPIPNQNSINNNSPEKLLKILHKLGDPQNNLPPTIHIAGTNGKGSTAAFLASIFQSAGYKTHIYTSPHLHHCNERIVIAHNEITDGYLYQLLEEVRIACEGISLTLFEGLTLAAILAFSKNPADICIIETGMGGRVDATNVIDKKIATILTSISLDHQDFLGDNLFKIACEKSHIMRSNVPCIIAPQNPEALQAIELRSLEISNQLIHFDQNFQIEINEDQTFNFSISPSKNFLSENFLGENFLGEKDLGEKIPSIKFNNLPKPALLGWHQYLNASLAIATICTISPKLLSEQNSNTEKDQNFNWDKAIRNGLRNVKWSSRLEKLHHHLLKKDDELWIDGAHNQGGFEVLADWLGEKIGDDFHNQKPKRNYLITGFSKHKAKAEFFLPFLDIIDFICAVRVAGEPNPEEAETVMEKILKSGIEEVKTKDDLFDAIGFLVNLDQQNPCRIIICGSLYLARDVKN